MSPVGFETWSFGFSMMVTVGQDYLSNLGPMWPYWGNPFGFNTVAPNMFSGMGPSRRPWKRKWTKWLTLSRIERPRWCRWTWRRLGVLGSGFHGKFHGSITVIATTFIALITIISTIIEIITIIVIHHHQHHLFSWSSWSYIVSPPSRPYHDIISLFWTPLVGIRLMW